MKINIVYLIMLFVIYIIYKNEIDYFLSKNYELRPITKTFQTRMWRFNDYSEHKETIDIILKNTNDDDSVLIWGNEAAINFLTKRSSPSKYFYQYPLFYSDYTNDHKINNFIDEVKLNKPQIIIDASGSTFSNAVDKGRVMSLSENKREALLMKSKDSKLYLPFEEFYRYVENNYRHFSSTYDNKWHIYCLNPCNYIDEQKNL